VGGGKKGRDFKIAPSTTMPARFWGEKKDSQKKFNKGTFKGVCCSQLRRVEGTGQTKKGGVKRGYRIEFRWGKGERGRDVCEGRDVFRVA